MVSKSSWRHFVNRDCLLSNLELRSIMNRIKELDLIRSSLWMGKLFCLNLFQGFSSYGNCNWVSPLNSPDRQRQGFIAIYLWKSFERIKPGGYQTTWTLRWPKYKHSVILYLLHYQYWRGCPYLTCVPLMISIQACNFNFLLDTDHYGSSSLYRVTWCRVLAPSRTSSSFVSVANCDIIPLG